MMVVMVSALLPKNRARGGRYGTFSETPSNHHNHHRRCQYRIRRMPPVLEVLGTKKVCCLLDPRNLVLTVSTKLILQTAGGRIRCPQCQARAKWSGEQCRRPATKGKRVCGLHGGCSTGPKTPEGRLRCAHARLTHGRETADARYERSLATARLAVLEEAGFALGLLAGPRTRGPKPHRVDAVEPELQQVLRVRAKHGS